MGMELSAEREKRKLKQMLRGFWGALVQYVIVWMITLCCSVYICIYETLKLADCSMFW